MTQSSKQHSLKQRSSAVTHPGCKRQQNQDSFLMDDEKHQWVVADGMGGHQGGEIASAIACQQIPEQLSAGASLEEALRSAHRAIVKQGEQQPELKGLGTTVVVVQEQGDVFDIAWSGDSRIYRWRAGVLKQLSEDHSIVQRMVKSGLLSPQQAKKHPHQHVISSCLGSTSSEGLEIGHQQFPWQRGDWLLLCSDGLTDELTDIQIAQLLAKNTTLESASAALLQAALDAGGRDNVSVALISAPDDAPKGASKTGPLQPLIWGVLGATIALAIVLAVKFFWLK